MVHVEIFISSICCNPALRPPRKRQSCRSHRHGAHVARRHRCRDCSGRCRNDRQRTTTPGSADTVPVLRRSDAHHRNVRTRLRAEEPARFGHGQDRHLMSRPHDLDAENNHRDRWHGAGNGLRLDPTEMTTNPATSRPGRSSADRPTIPRRNRLAYRYNASPIRAATAPGSRAPS